MKDEQGLVPYGKTGKQSGKGIKKALPIEAGEMTTALDMIINTSVQNLGRPAEYPATSQGLEDFTQNTIEYFEHIRTVNNDPNAQNYFMPDVESWAVYLGISRQTLWAYSKRGGAWQEVINFYKDCIGMVKKQLAMRFKIPPVFAIFDLVNNHQYLNSTEFKLTTEREDIGNTSNYIEDEVRRMGLIWDEKTGEYIPKGGEI